MIRIHHIKLYFAALAIFLVLDMLWLLVLARNFYQQQIGQYMRPDPNLYAAGAFYLLFIAGLLYFAILPGAHAPLYAALRGAFFGLLTYATYDLTNLAIMRDWPLLLTLVDLLWGSALCAVVAAATAWLNSRMGKALPAAQL